jgi:hypothetical protein
MKLRLNFVHINFVTFMKRIGQMKGVSKHGNEHSTVWAHFSTMSRIKFREIKVSLHFVHSRPKEKVSCFQLHDIVVSDKMMNEENLGNQESERVG